MDEHYRQYCLKCSNKDKCWNIKRYNMLDKCPNFFPCWIRYVGNK